MQISETKCCGRQRVLAVALKVDGDARTFTLMQNNAASILQSFDGVLAERWIDFYVQGIASAEKADDRVRVVLTTPFI